MFDVRCKLRAAVLNSVVESVSETDEIREYENGRTELFYFNSLTKNVSDD
jgi:hypothetical protein